MNWLSHDKIFCNRLTHIFIIRFRFRFRFLFSAFLAFFALFVCFTNERPVYSETIQIQTIRFLYTRFIHKKNKMINNKNEKKKKKLNTYFLIINNLTIIIANKKIKIGGGG